VGFSGAGGNEEVGMARMTPSEAMVETLRAEGVSVVTGIVGSAFMDALDLFPDAGIRFLPVRHEQTAAHMADAHARVTGTPGVCIGQNGPGVTNMVTSIAAAWLGHSPVVIVTPSAGTAAVGLDGFQEVDQMSIFASVTKWQVRVARPDRMAEAFRTAFRIAVSERGPVQVDVPRDFFYGEGDFEILEPHRYRASARGPGDDAALDRAAELLAGARRPIVISGMGVIEAEAVEDVRGLAEFLDAPVATSYLHNDAFPDGHELAVGPIGYQGSKAAMRLLSEADVVYAVGTRLSVFGTLPQYEFDYFPRGARIVHVDIDHRQLGRKWPVEVGVIGDAGAATRAILRRLAGRDGHPARSEERRDRIAEAKRAWEEELASRSSGEGTPISPRRALMELREALPEDAIVTTDIGNVCSAANAYLRFQQPRKFLAALTFGNCGFAYPAALGAKLARPGDPVAAVVGDGAWGMSLHEVMTAVEEDLPVVALVFNNQQWGAEKRNQVDFYDNRFVGTNIGHGLGGFDFAAIARAMGAQGIRVTEPGDLAGAYGEAFAAGRPTVLEIMVDPEELVEPFRRDALQKPVRFLEQYRHLSADRGAVEVGAA
jgi:sulfoacetaldehyde acetyltransferase